MFVVSQNNDYFFTLPDARTGSTGIAARFVNQGAFGFKILDSLGNLLVSSVNPGDVYDIELEDNSTPEGVWWQYKLGATTSGADAALLAGLGLTANPATSRLDVQPDVVNTSSLPSGFTKGSQASFVNWIGTTASISLPAYEATPGGVQSGYWLVIKNSSPGNGILTLEPPLGATIDGNANISLTSGQSLTLYFDGTNYTSTSLTQNTFSGAVQITPLGIRVINGSSSNPSYSFISSPTTGIYTGGSNDVKFTVLGNEIGSFDTTGLNVLNLIKLENDDIRYYTGIYP
jgi:hypothetical protein